MLLAIFFVQRMYQRRRPVSHLDESYKIGRLVTLAVMLTLALVTLFLPDFFYRRNLVVYAWAISIVILVLARAIHAQAQWQAQARGIGDDRVLLIGAGEVGQMILQKILNTPKLGFQVVGIVDNSNLRRLMDVPVLGGYADIPQIIEHYGVDEVIIGLPESSHQEIVGIISLCEREKVGIRVFPDVFQIMASEVSIGDLGGLPLLTVRDVALQGWKLTLKRAVDVVGSGIGMVLVSPFMLMTALLIKLESPGPVFYTQERMGLDARPFKIIKFRSMRAGRRGQRPRLDDRGRSPAHQAGLPVAPLRGGRVAPVDQRADRRHEPGGAATGAPGLRRTVPPAHPPLHGPPPGKSGHDRLGPGQRHAGRHLHRRAHQV